MSWVLVDLLLFILPLFIKILMEISLNVQIICEIINIVVILSCLSLEYDIYFHIQIFFIKNNFIKI